MMLISLVLFIPDKEDVKTVAIDGITPDYLLYFPANNKLYNGNDMDKGTWTEVDASSLNITCEGLDANGDYVLRFNGVDFKTTDFIGLGIYDYSGETTNVKIILEGKNRIETLDSNKYKGNEQRAIVNWQGSLTFEGDGTLEAVAKGHSGVAISSCDYVYINGGNIYTYGGTRGDAAGIRADDGVSITGGYVYANTYSSNSWTGGIETTNGNNGETVSITGGKVDVDIAGDKVVTENTTADDVHAIGCVGIEAGKVIIENSEVNVNMKGMHKVGIGAKEGSEDNGVYIQNNAKVSINGDVCRGEVSGNYDDSIGIYAKKVL